MPATRPETPARPTPPSLRCRPLLALALAGLACAANSRQDATPVAVQATLDEAPAGAPMAAPPAEAPAERDELEASLAAYEQQLAYNESRLRAMGVRIAAVGEAGAPDDGDDRFAPPPPSPADSRAADKRREPGKAKAAQQSGRAEESPRPGADAAAPTAAPSPRPPTTKPATSGPKQPSRSAGASSADAKPEAKNADRELDRCGELCELADATCDLELKICDLASRHTDEPRYAEVCRRAGEDCRLAADACDRCSP